MLWNQCLQLYACEWYNHQLVLIGIFKFLLLLIACPMNNLENIEFDVHEQFWQTRHIGKTFAN